MKNNLLNIKKLFLNDEPLSEADAKSLLDAAKNGNTNLEAGAIECLTDVVEYHFKHYMHYWSGDVATGSEWYSDYKSMSLEDWFGKEASECVGKHWMRDFVQDTGEPCLIEVVFIDGEWVDANNQ